MPKNEQPNQTPDIKSLYKSIARQHVLPDFDAINFDFEVEMLEETNYFIRQIRMRMLEKVGFFSKIIEELLNPDSGSLVQLHEYRYLTDEDKTLLYSWLKKFMGFDRKSSLYVLAPDDKKEAALVKEIFTDWQVAKRELMPLLKKVADAWVNGVESKDEQARYLG